MDLGKAGQTRISWIRVQIRPILDFWISWIFGIPIFRTPFEKIDPPWPLRANHYVEKDPIWILSMLGFRQKPSKVFVFTNKIILFHENPVSSVRPSEASSGRFLCFHPDSGGLLDFRILHFPETMVPVATGAMAPVDTGEFT